MALALAAALVGAALQSAVGFGFALVLGAALFSVLEPDDALLCVLGLSLLLNLLMLFSERRERRVRPELRILLLAAAPGLACGALIFNLLSEQALQIAVGISVIAGAALDLGRPGTPVEAAADPIARWTALPVGFAGGLLTTTTTTNGPPLLLFYRARGFSPAELRDTMAAILLALNVAGIGFALVASDAELDLEPGSAAGLIGAVVAGYLIGRLIFARLDARRFHAAGLALIIVAGAASLLAGLSAL